MVFNGLRCACNRSHGQRGPGFAVYAGVVAVGALSLAGCGGSGSSGGSSQPSTNAGTTVTTTTGTGGASSTVTTTSGGTRVVTAGGTWRIPVIPKGTTHEYWKSIHAGAAKAEAEINQGSQKIQIIWKGPELENDRQSQIDIVESFISQGVQGMVLAPLDDQALVRPVKDATAKQIPVVIIDSGLQSNDYVSFIATDNEKGGELGGQRLGQLLNGKGRVILLRYQVGSSSTDLREKGFLAAMKKFPGITLISDNQYAGATVDSAYTASQSLLSRYGSQVDGIFTPNESSTRGMLKALEQSGMLSKVKFVGFDTSPDLITALQAGQLQGLVAQNPFKMGYLGVKTLVDSMQGKKVDKRIDTGVTLITPENLNTPAIQQLVNPPLAQYLK